MFPDLSSKFFSFARIIKKLPWKVFATVLCIHLGILWWLLCGHFSQEPDILPEPLFVTLESFETYPSELSNQSALEETAKDDLVGHGSERSDRAEGWR